MTYWIWGALLAAAVLGGVVGAVLMGIVQAGRAIDRIRQAARARELSPRRHPTPNGDLWENFGEGDRP